MDAAGHIVVAGGARERLVRDRVEGVVRGGRQGLQLLRWSAVERVRGHREGHRLDFTPVSREELPVAGGEDLVADGAVVRTGGVRRGAVYEPTVLTDVPAGAKVLTEEVFGPVVSVMAFDELPTAIAAANDSEYALQAGVFTQSVETAFAVSSGLVAGAVVVNGTSDLRVDSMPFGGFKSSGVGREGVRYAVEAMTEPKNTIVNLLP